MRRITIHLCAIQREWVSEKIIIKFLVRLDFYPNSKIYPFFEIFDFGEP